MQPDPASLAAQTLAVAVVAEAGSEAGSAEAAGRLVVVGDGDFMTSQFVRANPQNLAFAANAIDWLAQDEALIAIQSKDRAPAPLVFESEFQQAALKCGNMIGVPLIFIVLGTMRVLRRRRLAGPGWEESAGGEAAA